MSDSSRQSSESAPDGAVSIHLDRFEDAWQRGRFPELKDFLPPGGDSDHRRELLAELIMIDLEYRWLKTSDAHASTISMGPDTGIPERPLIEDYLQQYPELGDLDELDGCFLPKEEKIAFRILGE